MLLFCFERIVIPCVEWRMCIVTILTTHVHAHAVLSELISMQRGNKNYALKRLLLRWTSCIMLAIKKFRFSEIAYIFTYIQAVVLIWLPLFWKHIKYYQLFFWESLIDLSAFDWVWSLSKTYSNWMKLYLTVVPNTLERTHTCWQSKCNDLNSRLIGVYLQIMAQFMLNWWKMVLLTWKERRCG